MNLITLLVLPLVGGFAFSTTWIGSVFHASRESGHRLYFRAVFYGVFLVICATFLHICFYIHSPFYLVLINLLADITDLSDTQSAIFSQQSKCSILFLSFILGPVLGYVLSFPKFPFLINAVIPGTGIKPFYLIDKWLLEQAIKNDDFEKILMRSVYTGTPILFTLNNRKVYLAWVVGSPNPNQDRKYVRALPMASGYRDKDFLTLEFTTHYYHILHNASPDALQSPAHYEDYEVVIAASQIVHCHLFDLVAYNESQEQIIEP